MKMISTTVTAEMVMYNGNLLLSTAHVPVLLAPSAATGWVLKELLPIMFAHYDDPCRTYSGDGHDKDITLAIRYAVDNGARVINFMKLW